MNSLFLLQFCCMIVTISLALLVALSRFYVKWVNKRYEQSRKFLVLSMICLSVHYFFQMRYGLRASGDDVGMLANIIFYTPTAFLVTCAIVNLECSRRSTRRCMLGGFVGCCIIYVAAGIWYICNRSIHFGIMLYILYALFIACIILFMFSSHREIRYRRRILETETAGDMLPYMRYTYNGGMLLFACLFLILFSILSSKLLMIFGLVALLLLFIFVLSFVALGFNILPIEDVLDDCTPEMAPDKTQAELTEQGNLTDPSEKRIEHIEKALQEWASSGGFRDPGVTLASLSHQLHILRSDLTYYFEQHLQRTFRVWLSDIRFQEVQRMMIQYPDYNNDAISSECGFSSRAHLYRIFKQKTGMTPGEWKASGSYQALGDTDTR